MNLREGTRRLALLLGAAGAIACGFLSYAQLQSTLRQRADHQRFEQLANSDVVKQERKNLQTQAPDFIPANPYAPADPYAAIALPNPSDVNQGGIKTINWTHDFGVASIETQDGQTLYPTPAPGAWSYVLIAILPLLGFFVPWGAIRAIGWVLAGFVQSSK